MTDFRVSIIYFDPMFEQYNVRWAGQAWTYDVKDGWSRDEDGAYVVTPETLDVEMDDEAWEKARAVYDRHYQAEWNRVDVGSLIEKIGSVAAERAERELNLDGPQCEASSWEYGKKPGDYGPAGINRCTLAAGHERRGVLDHEDGWGIRWHLGYLGSFIKARESA